MSWNGVFMAEVQKHECLYNKFSREYRNRELRDECWKKVGEKFGMSPMAAEKKFRNIRTGYGRYLKKRRSNPSLANSQDFTPFGFENCEWLAVHIIHRGSTSNNECTSTQQLVDNANGSDDETSPVTMSNIEFLNSGDYNDASYESDHQDTDLQQEICHTVQTKSTMSTELVEIQTKPSNDTVTTNQGQEGNSKQLISCNHNTTSTTRSQPLEIEPTSSRSFIPRRDLIREEIPLEIPSNSTIIPQQYLKRKYKELEDEDELYCRSLVPRLKRLTPQAKAFVRIQLEQLLYNAEYSRETPHLGAPLGLNFTERTPTSFLNGRSTEQSRK